MTIHLDGFAWAQALVGVPFPEADEDALRRCGQAWRVAAGQLRQLPVKADALGADVWSALDGSAGARFAQVWHPLTRTDGPFGQLADACEVVAAACDHAATEVEYAKLSFLVALGVLAATLAALAAAMAASAGTAGLGMPIAIAAAQFTVRAVLTRLLAGVVLGAATNAAMDLTVQVSQVIRGTREGWDAERTVSAAGDGAIFGGLTGAVLVGGAVLAPGAFANGWGILGGLGLSGVLGTAAVGVLHGERPDATELLFGITSGVVGGLGPGLIGARSPSGVGVPLPAFDGDAAPWSTAQGGAPPVLAGWGGTPSGVVDGSVGPAPAPGGILSSTVDGHAGDTPRPASPPMVPAWSPPIPTTAPHAVRPPDAAPPAQVTASASSQGASTTTTLPSPAGAPLSAALPAPSGVGPPHVPQGTVPPPNSAPLATPAVAQVGSTPTAAGPSPPASPHASASAVPPIAVMAAQSTAITPMTAIPPSTAIPPQVMASTPIGALSDSGSAPFPPGAEPSDGGGGSATPGVPRALSDAEAMARARESLFRTGAGYGFYPAGDDNRAFANAIKPTPGYVTIDVHGSLRGFTIDDGRLTPGQFATALRELIARGDLTIRPGEGIRLIACDTADGGATSPAAVLADQLGVDVLAPDRVVWTAIDGEEIVASPRLVGGVFLPVDPPDGRWHLFTPDPAPVHP